MHKPLWIVDRMILYGYNVPTYLNNWPHKKARKISKGFEGDSHDSAPIFPQVWGQ